VSDPQLRCLLCDLILADESAKGQATERCRQCGRDILAGQTQPMAAGDEPLTLQPLGRVDQPPPLPPPPVSAALEDELPVASVVPKSPSPEVPTFGPRPRSSAPPDLPPLGKKPVQKAPLPPPPPRKTTLPDPPRTRSGPPRPQMITALGVLGCMTVLIILCLAVIAYAILFGLQKARKAGKAEAPAVVRVA
jgi:hypothetical protein